MSCWDWEKNDLDPTKLTKGSGRKIWLICDKCEHSFQAAVGHVTTGTWCPFCANQKLCEDDDCNTCFEKTLASHPRIKLWSKENTKSPRQITKNSQTKVLFVCECKHTFQASAANISKGQWCPYCSSPPKRLCDDEGCESCFNNSFASNSKAKRWSPKNELLPRHLFKGAVKAYFFDCECGHTFKARLMNINKGEWCPYCRPSPRLVCDDEKCQHCLKKSFASHPKAVCWSEENKKTARQVLRSANSSFKFNCECGHTFEACLNDVSNGTWCPYCAGKKLCDRECDQCFNKSFASHPSAEFWDPENEKTARQVFKSSGEKYSFICKCGHKFSLRTAAAFNGRFCPYCSKRKICGKEECKDCKQRSMASHPSAEFWSEKNSKAPIEVSKGNHLEIFFVCENKHKFCMPAYSVTKGAWCPFCKNKGETKLYKFLESEGYALSREKTFNWCKNEAGNANLRFDFEIKNGYKVLIELDGHQHFRQVRNWLAPEKALQRDLYKMNLANENGYAIIRITWNMVYYDYKNWKKKLVDAIETIEPSTRLYICTNNEYDAYQVEEVQDPQESSPESSTEEE